MTFLIFLPAAILVYAIVFHAGWTGRIWTVGIWNPKTSDRQIEPFKYWVAVGAYIVLATGLLMVSLHDLFGGVTTATRAY